jgi:hypothetical protein
MALYEIVLQRNEARHEIRFTDHRPLLGSTLVIDGRSWLVHRSEPSVHEIAHTRFICVIPPQPSPVA